MTRPDLHTGDERADRWLDAVLSTMYEQVGEAVQVRLTGQGGPPELRDPDLALGRLLASAHRQTGAAVTARRGRILQDQGPKKACKSPTKVLWAAGTH